MRIPGTRNPNSYILHWQHSQFPPSELWSQAFRWPSGIAVLTYHGLCNLLRRKKPHFLFPIYLTTDAAAMGKKNKKQTKPTSIPTQKKHWETYVVTPVKATRWIWKLHSGSPFIIFILFIISHFRIQLNVMQLSILFDVEYSVHATIFDICITSKHENNLVIYIHFISCIEKSKTRQWNLFIF